MRPVAEAVPVVADSRDRPAADQEVRSRQQKSQLDQEVRGSQLEVRGSQLEVGSQVEDSRTGRQVEDIQATSLPPMQQKNW